MYIDFSLGFKLLLITIGLVVGEKKGLTQIEDITILGLEFGSFGHFLVALKFGGSLLCVVLADQFTLLQL